MGKLIDFYANQLNNLTFTEKQVLYFIENNLEQAKEMPLTKLAEKNSVSTTTVIRLSHKLGYSGFSELKFQLRNIHSEINSLKIAKPKNPMDQFLTDLTTGLNHLDESKIGKAAKQIKEANKIIVISVGLTKTAGEYLSKRLMQLNLSSSYLYESHMIDLISNWVSDNDLFIFLSSSGETDTLLVAAEKLSHLPVPTIVLSNNPDSTLMQKADIGLSLSVKNLLYEGYDISARSFLVILSDLLVDYYRDLKEDLE